MSRAGKEKQLRESKERYRSMFEEHRDVMLLVDPESGRILDANRAAAQFYGYEVSRLRCMTIDEINMLPRGEIMAMMQEVVNNVRDFFVFPHRLSNGETRTVEVRSSFVPYQGRKVLFSIVHDITARRHMEHERALMLFALNHVSEEVFLADEEACIRFANETACDALGYSKDEFRKLRIPDIDPDFPIETWADHLQELRKSGSLRFESRHRTKDGRLYPVEVSSSYFEYEDGSYIFGLAKDITKRKRAEHKIARLTRLYAVLSRTNEEIIRTFDVGDLYAKACRILVEDGLFRMAWIGAVQPETGMVVPVAHSGHEEGYLENIRVSVMTDTPEGSGPTGTALREGRFFVNNDTENNPVMLPWREEALKRGYRSTAAVPIRTDKSAVGVLTVYAGERDYFDEEIVEVITSLAHDIAFAIEHRRAEKEMAFLASVVENVPDAVCSIDTSGTIFSWNRAAGKMLGYAAEELFGKHISVTIPKELAEKELDHCMGILNAEGSISGYESVRLAKNGRAVPVEITAVAMKDKTGSVTAYVSIMRDITDRRKLEGQLRHAQKMEAIGTLAGGIAHDFNNILNIIIGYGAMVREQLLEDTRSREQIDEVLRAADRAVNLVTRLLVFSRKQAIEMRPVNIDEIIAGMGIMISRLIGEDIFFSTELAGEELLVNADTGQIEQVIMNLVTNARDAMPKGGRLTIATGLSNIDEDYIVAHGYGKTGTYVLITVTDTGVGMDRETQKKIFEPFFTTKEVGRGTGLGLAMAYGIIKQHEGYIQVYSEEGKGAAFKILLPVIKNGTSGGPRIETAASPRGGTETLLVAEDEPSLRKMMKIVLESFGYSVITADDGEDAVAKYVKNREKIRLVILDMIMPKKSGKEAYDEIRQISPDVKPLFASGYSIDVIHKKELPGEGTDFILKPVTPKELLKKVRQMLDR